MLSNTQIQLVTQWLLLRDWAEFTEQNPTSLVKAQGGLFREINPLFPALRSGPTAGSGAYPKSKFLAAILNSDTIACEVDHSKNPPDGQHPDNRPTQARMFSPTFDPTEDHSYQEDVD